jgi:hypothetical protein
MSSVTHPAPDNLLIERLPQRERARLMSICEPVDLTFGEILCTPDLPYRSVYFPRGGFISLMLTVGGHPPLEMGMIGNEGMLGATLSLGVDAAPLLGMVQGNGSAWRIDARHFRRELATNKALRAIVDQYLFVLMAQLSQSAACTRFHEVEARLARWLLMTHDRAHADHFHLTHQFLADMLGVQRSAVTIAAGSLQRQHFIHYSRGEINILSRSGLEATSCECYGAVNSDYAERFDSGAAAAQHSAAS